MRKYIAQTDRDGDGMLNEDEYLELLRKERYDEKVDVWGFACILECLHTHEQLYTWRADEAPHADVVDPLLEIVMFKPNPGLPTPQSRPSWPRPQQWRLRRRQRAIDWWSQKLFTKKNGCG